MDPKSLVRDALLGATAVPDDDVVDELAQHVEAVYAAARADGLAHDEALTRVMDHLDRWKADAAALHRPSPRTASVPPPPMATRSRSAGVMQDVRYALRVLRRQPRFTAAALITMAVGIGATTGLFSLTYGVLMKPLPWAGSDRLIVLTETRGGNPPRFGAVSNAAYLSWRDGATTIDDVAAWSQRTVTLTDTGEPQRIRVTAASASLFAVLGVRPLLGSFFAEGDERAPGQAGIVVSETLWRERFGGDATALGRVVQIDGRPYRVAGVLADAVAFPDRRAQAWIPFSVPPATGGSLSMFNAVARLRPGETIVRAEAEATTRGQSAADAAVTAMAIFGSRGPIVVSAQPLRDAMSAGIRRPLLVLLAAVVLMLVSATASTATLQLARNTTRRRELGIRVALGASGGRLLSQLLVESLVLGLGGGALGVAVAWGAHRVLPVLLPADFPRAADLGIDAMVLLFAFSISVTTSIAFGVLPGLGVRHLDPIVATARRAARRGIVRYAAERSRLLLVGAQVAIACVLLIGASLLGQSFVRLLTAERGYEPAGVLSARLSLPATAYSPERRHQVIRDLLARLRALPAVDDAAVTSELPVTPEGSTSAFTLQARDADGQPIVAQASPRIVSPAYFTALQIRVVAGRPFSEADDEVSPAVIVVNRAFARKYLGDSPIGARLPMGAGYGLEHIQATVVGVADDVRYVTAADSSRPEVYYSYLQFGGRLPVSTVTLLARTHGDAVALVSAVREATREADARLVPDAVGTMDDLVLTTLTQPRLYAVLLGAFATVALVIAGVGVFGVLSYSVAQRAGELAVRTALGARRGDIVALVVGRTLAVTMGGLAAGLLASLALTRSMGAMLYGIGASDALTYATVAAGLVAVAMAASLPPIRDALRLDPVQALRR